MLNIQRLFILAVALLMATPAMAQPAQEIEQMLRQRDREIKSIVGTSGEPTAAQRERLKNVVNDAIDFEAMSRAALGTFWSELTPAQQRAFVERFSEVVRAQSLADLQLYRAAVTYSGVDVNGSTALARTIATIGSDRARVDYTLHRVNNQWQVTNIIVDGVGTAEGYARSFQRVLRQHGAQAGYDRIMASLANRLSR